MKFNSQKLLHLARLFQRADRAIPRFATRSELMVYITPDPDVTVILENTLLASPGVNDPDTQELTFHFPRYPVSQPLFVASAGEPRRDSSTNHWDSAKPLRSVLSIDDDTGLYKAVIQNTNELPDLITLPPDGAPPILYIIGQQFEPLPLT